MKKAADLYKKIGRVRNYLFEYLDICSELEYVGPYSEVISLCDSIIAKASPQDSVILGHTYAHLATAYCRMAQTSNAHSAINLAIKYYGNDINNVAGLLFLTNCYTITNDIDSVRKYINICNQLTLYKNDVTHLANLKWLATQTNDFNKAYIYADSIALLINNTAKYIINQQGVFAQADFYLWQLETEQAKNSTKNKIFLISIFVCIISLAICRHYYRKRQEKLQNQISKKIAEISQLRDDIFHLNNELNTAKSDKVQRTNFKALINIGFTTFDSITKSLYSREFEGNLDDTKINISVQAGIKQLKDIQFLNQIIYYVNYEYSDVIKQLLISLPKIKGIDTHMVALRLVGFSAQSICILLNISSSNYYTRWHRLRDKILKLPNNEKSYFVNILGIH